MIRRKAGKRNTDEGEGGSIQSRRCLSYGNMGELLRTTRGSAFGSLNLKVAHLDL